MKRAIRACAGGVGVAAVLSPSRRVFLTVALSIIVENTWYNTLNKSGLIVVSRCGLDIVLAPEVCCLYRMEAVYLALERNRRSDGMLLFNRCFCFRL